MQRAQMFQRCFTAVLQGISNCILDAKLSFSVDAKFGECLGGKGYAPLPMNFARLASSAAYMGMERCTRAYLLVTSAGSAL